MHDYFTSGIIGRAIDQVLEEERLSKQNNKNWSRGKKDSYKKKLKTKWKGKKK